MLVLFLSLGLVLESLHGFKIDWYLNVTNETRRLMWTLAHAHGTLLALVHIAFAATVHMLDCPDDRWPKLLSPALIAGSILLPGGFLLGGLYIYAGDPGPGILGVPAGALLLLLSAVWVARAASRK